jgi:hypothetical protein
MNAAFSDPYVESLRDPRRRRDECDSCRELREVRRLDPFPRQSPLPSEVATALKRRFSSTDIPHVSGHEDRLGRILSSALTKRNAIPTTVEVDGRYAYVHEKGADYAMRFFVPSEAYDALARHEEYDGEGFVIELLPSVDQPDDYY